MHKNIGKCIGSFPLYSIIREASDWSQIHASVNLPSQCQTVGVVKRYLQPLEELGVLQQMVWSPQTLDHHIMETDWDYMNVKKQSRQPKSTGELTKMQECAGVRLICVYKKKCNLPLKKNNSCTIIDKYILTRT